MYPFVKRKRALGILGTFCYLLQQERLHFDKYYGVYRTLIPNLKYCFDFSGQNILVADHIPNPQIFTYFIIFFNVKVLLGHPLYTQFI